MLADKSIFSVRNVSVQIVWTNRKCIHKTHFDELRKYRSSHVLEPQLTQYLKNIG